MDAALKELSKLQKLTSFAAAVEDDENESSAATLTSGKGKLTSSLAGTLDNLIAALRDIKERVEAGTASEDDVASISKIVEERRKDIDERQREIYGTLGRIGKALDKRFANPMPEIPSLFTSDEAQKALQRSIALHFLRTGQFDTSDAFLKESIADISPQTSMQFKELHDVLKSLRSRDVEPALKWCAEHHDFLERRKSALEFRLHRSQFMHLLLSVPSEGLALIYAKTHLQPLYGAYTSEINRLLACFAYLPPSRLRTSPYADLASPSLYDDLEPMFAKEYCASLGMSRQVPLRVIGDIAGGGALARIEKGRKLMRERKSEWSQADELPIEIPLAEENRYHSIFACPVSKEQATPTNPPMMITCGHVLARDSLTRLAKTQGRVKCPYCPQESQLRDALEVHF